MPVTSAGLLVHRRGSGGVEVLLVHPGGPFWRSKDLGAWSIPKGETNAGEDLLAAARRECEEELGIAIEGEALPLGMVKQAGGKIVHAWAVRADVDPASIRSNVFELEWPRGSGRKRSFPEVDRAGWFSIEEARSRMLSAQTAFLDRLLAALDRAGSRP
jgi:predicted NUDIX family NTP pyrophosphohydrolase